MTNDIAVQTQSYCMNTNKPTKARRQTNKARETVQNQTDTKQHTKKGSKRKTKNINAKKRK